MYAYILSIICLSLVISCSMVGSNDLKMGIAKDKAIEITNVEAKKLGYDIETMNIKATKYKTPWNEYISKSSDDNYSIEKKNKLQNKEYWAVYYSSNHEKVGIGYKGGDFCIFIDSNTGKIITVARWK